MSDTAAFFHWASGGFCWGSFTSAHQGQKGVKVFITFFDYDFCKTMVIDVLGWTLALLGCGDGLLILHDSYLWTVIVT